MRLLAATLLLALTACAQDPTPNQGEPAEPTSEAAADLTPAQQAYKEANDRMHAGMASVDADPDVAFMQGMLAHHKGAVEMSEVALEHADEYVRQAALIRAELAYQNHVAALPACQALPRGPIHADLFRDNVMFDGDRLCGFFDFYFAGCDTFLFDIAVCLNDWCVSHDADPALDGRHNAARAAALLSAYQAVRPLTAAERQLLPALLRAGALRFWLSRLWDLHLPREAALLQPHDPGHFERVLRGRLQGGLTEAAALLDPAFETA